MIEVYGTLNLLSSDIIENDIIQKNVKRAADDTARDNIESPEDGMLVVTLSDHKINIYKGGAGWVKLEPADSQRKVIVIASDQEIIMSTTGGTGSNGAYVTNYDVITGGTGGTGTTGETGGTSHYFAHGDKGLFIGGPSYTNYIEKIDISTTGNADFFGGLGYNTYDSRFGRYRHGSFSNGNNNRGIAGGGTYGRGIDYFSISISSLSSTFGALLNDEVHHWISGCSNDTSDRGVFGSYWRGSYINTIQYITISTLGNSLDFGDLNNTIYSYGSTSNGISDRGVFFGGYAGAWINVIDYITISSTGDATDFGDLTTPSWRNTSTSNLTGDRGINFATNNGATINTINYITISSTGDATDFGDVTNLGNHRSSTSNGSDNRAVVDCGSTNNQLEYITISSTGDALSFGELQSAQGEKSACSNGASWYSGFTGGTGGATGGSAGWGETGGVRPGTQFFQLPDEESTINYMIIKRKINPVQLQFPANHSVNFKVDVKVDFDTTLTNRYIEIKYYGNKNWFLKYEDDDCTLSYHGDTGVISGTTSFHYITISTLCNSDTFSDVTSSLSDTTGYSNGSGNYGVFSQTNKTFQKINLVSKSNSTTLGVIDYTISIPASCTNLNLGRVYISCAWTNGGYSSYMFTSSILTPDFDIAGSLSGGRTSSFGAACSNGVLDRGIFCGGNGSPSWQNTMDFVTISTMCRALSFGELSTGRGFHGGSSNYSLNRGVFVGGSNASGDINTIEYITINSLGNASSFGEISQTAAGRVNVTNGVNNRVVFIGDKYGAVSNIMEYINILTLGNTTSFGETISDVGGAYSATSNSE